MNAAGDVLPQLAEGWTLPDDGPTHVFSLMLGAKFHDGTAFDAKDEVFGFARAMAPGSVNPSRGIFKPIDSVKAPHPHTVEIRLKNKDAFLLFDMARDDAAIVAPETAGNNATTPRAPDRSGMHAGRGATG